MSDNLFAAFGGPSDGLGSGAYMDLNVPGKLNHNDTITTTINPNTVNANLNTNANNNNIMMMGTPGATSMSVMQDMVNRLTMNMISMQNRIVQLEQQVQLLTLQQQEMASSHNNSNNNNAEGFGPGAVGSPPTTPLEVNSAATTNSTYNNNNNNNNNTPKGNHYNPTAATNTTNANTNNLASLFGPGTLMAGSEAVDPVNSLNALFAQQQQQFIHQMQQEALMAAMLGARSPSGYSPNMSPTFNPSAAGAGGGLVFPSGNSPVVPSVPAYGAIGTNTNTTTTTANNYNSASAGAKNNNNNNNHLGANNNPNNNNNNNNINAVPVTIDPQRGTNEVLERACAMQPDMRELCLRGCKYITSINPVCCLKNLWRLNLQGCVHFVDDQAVQLICMSIRRLSRLNLCGCERITDASSLAQLQYLFDLNLSGCMIGNDTLEAIAGKCSQLSRLAINSCPNLTSVASLGQLKVLKLLYCRYSSNIDPASLAGLLLTNGGVLLTLNVDGLQFESLGNLENLPNPTALNFLNLKDNFALKDLRWLTAVPKAESIFGGLEMLDVEGCSALTELGPIEKLPSLKVLRLSRTGITQEQLDSHVTECRELTTLHIDGCGDPSLVSFQSLTKLKKLKRLSVDSATKSQHAMFFNSLKEQYKIEVAVANNNNNNGNNNNHFNNGHHGADGNTNAAGKNNNNNMNNNHHLHNGTAGTGVANGSPSTLLVNHHYNYIGGNTHHSPFTTPTAREPSH